jgi:preprotein translocase subunit YajC
MSEEKIKFKVGDRVKLVAKKYIDSPKNPLWGSRHGKIVGTITKVLDTTLSIKVNWDNGEENYYDEKDLELIIEDENMDEIEELKETIKKCSERLEKLEKKRESKYYLRLDEEDTAIGEGDISFFIVNKNRDRIDCPYLLIITKDGTLVLKRSINSDIGLELYDGHIVIE